MDIEEWTRAIMAGRMAPLGLPETGVARYVIRCLANPACYGSEEVLARIRERRETLRASARHAEVAAIFGADLAPESHDGEEEGP